MTEDEARAWLERRSVSRETMEKLEAYRALLFAEMSQQNLIAPSTVDSFWARHIVDSAQLLELAPVEKGALWVDLGSGAGLPGIVIALLGKWDVLLLDSRRKRVEFLDVVIQQLGLANAEARLGKVQSAVTSRVPRVISARAFASLDNTFAAAEHIADAESFWLLPKGKSWQSDVELARANWHGSFHVEQSVTDPDSAIIVAKGVRRKGRR